MNKFGAEKFQRVRGETVREALLAGKILSTGVVCYRLVNGELISTGHFSGECWPAPFSVDDLADTGRFFDVLKEVVVDKP